VCLFDDTTLHVYLTPTLSILDRLKKRCPVPACAGLALLYQVLRKFISAFPGQGLFLFINLYQLAGLYLVYPKRYGLLANE